ncbi:MAG: type II secretion system protein [Chthoniobacterales bacterium]|nr:type II secretion system protein [Chthoniobacterales bacterium]
MSDKSRHSARGLTMIEVLVSIAIVSILASMVTLAWPRVMASVAAAKCMGNMRSLHVSLGSYVTDTGHWPQLPENLDVSGSNDAAYEDWWLEELKPYGGIPSVWQCPLIQSKISNKDPDGRPRIHYTPTPFDEIPSTPFKWPTQPWLVEIGNIHGRGANICFTDGSIRSMDDVLDLN